MKMPEVPESVIDGITFTSIGAIIAGTQDVLSAGLSGDDWLQIAGMIVAVIVAFLRGKKKGK